MLGRTKEVNLWSFEKCREKGSRLFQKKRCRMCQKKKRGRILEMEKCKMPEKKREIDAPDAVESRERVQKKTVRMKKAEKI